MSNEIQTTETSLQPYEKNYLLNDDQWNLTWKQCSVFVKSGFLPKAINTVEKCVSVVLMGRELGLAPMTALCNISIINGKPTLEAKLMLGLILKKYPNAYYKIISNTAQVAEVCLGRNADIVGKFSYTITQAREAGLLSKDNWKYYPADMLLWRAISRGCRVMFPDVLTVTAHSEDEIEPIIIEPEQTKELTENKIEVDVKAIDNPEKINPKSTQKSEKITTNKILDKILPNQEGINRHDQPGKGNPKTNN